MTAHKVELKTVLVYGPLAAPLLDDFRSTFDEVLYYPITPFAPRDESESLPTDDDYARADVLFGFQIPFNLKDWKQTPRLKLFQGCSAGYGHVTDTEYFKSIPEDADVIFASASGIHVSTIGEHVLGTVLMLTHKLAYLNVALHNEQRWVPHKELGGQFIRDLNTLKVGIMGYGHIGRETARLFHSCGSTIYALTRGGTPTPESGYIIKGTGDPTGSLPEQYFSTSSRSSTLSFFSTCDVVVNTLPDSPATRGFVGKEELKAMKGDAIYVNIGRGTTTDQDALVEALQAKKGEDEEESATGTLRIGGASLDVTTPEPLPSPHPLYTLPNVVLTPHMSGLSQLYMNRCVDVLKVNTERLRKGQGALNAFRGRGEDD
ncbi:D-isomer specific 2-hydroxyacid dehydrogenase [Rhodotorula toruloides]|uniref:BY PROTMAP: gi/472584265/gb/EMS21871.1/ D-isomer specific 2-hydroxyacid dehydrogenase [Rhodosporidium toruloides NP11] gi/647394409/emb/CDR35638.1/ RHTO0S01e03818g1_1 [Rhodosporidium toruloides] n=1 Tax=Rhodotorula toruloides TaxID=5286 RepID=A0A0K3CQL4_RHOTO|nr:D-isomer specific 2-hydroxyacid dehydrogenase [Rhodotorula toruloides]PRQ72181.1 hypothetical protein AAT19DRAFT_9520 [Rhodotorula toruloides]